MRPSAVAAHGIRGHSDEWIGRPAASGATATADGTRGGHRAVDHRESVACHGDDAGGVETE